MKKIYESPEMQSLRFIFPEDIAEDPGWGDNEFDASSGWGEEPPLPN